MVKLKMLNRYFPEASKESVETFVKMQELYEEWNQKINVISRKDMEHFEERHLIHSLAIAKLNLLKPGCRVMDLGAGGGFPGIPLAILLPEVEFTLVDSIRKKTRVMEEIAQHLGLKNVNVINGRAEEVKQKFDYIVCRAVAPLVKLNNWCSKSIDKSKAEHGMLCLKGGDLFEEIAEFEERYPDKQVLDYPINDFYDEEFYSTKRIIRVMNY